MILWRISCLERLKYLLILAFVSFLISCGGGSGGSALVSTMLSWTAPTIRENGDALPLSDIKSYRIYFGVEAGKYPGVVDVADSSATAYQWAGVPSGAYFVVMTTVDVDGRESGFSPEIKVTI